MSSEASAAAPSGSAAAAAGAAGGADLPLLTLEILDTIKTAQNQNGLRHNDYARYKAYCTRRLDKIRHAKAVSFTFGKGKKFEKKELTAAKVTDPRHLAIPLMMAERAWADYSALKAELEAGASIARQRNHCALRLKKAAKHASELETLAAIRGDLITSLEARAYSGFISGTLGVELLDWASAVKGIATARIVYESLAAAPSTPRRQRELFAGRAEELTAQERFCRYNFDKEAKAAAKTTKTGGGAAAVATSAAILEQIQKSVAEALGSAASGAGAVSSASETTALASLEGAAGSGGGSSSSSDDSGRVTELYWKGTSLPMRNEKVVKLLTTAAQKARQLIVFSSSSSSSVAASSNAAGSGSGSGSGSREGTAEGLYLELTSKLDEAARALASDAARAAKEGKQALALDHTAAEECLRFIKARFVLERNAVLVDNAAKGYENAANGSGAPASSAGAGSSSSSSSSSGKAKGKGKKAAAAEGAASASSSEGSSDSSAGAAEAAVKIPPSSKVFGANPWLAALTESHVTAGASADAGKGGVTSSSSGGGPVNPAASKLAFQVSSWLGRSVRTLDEMLAMAESTLSSSSSSPASAGAGSAGAAGGVSSELSPDLDLVAALRTRKQAISAWRSYYLALSYLHARRYVDATKLMNRAQQRADEALEALRLLPSSLKPKDLPKMPLYPLLDAAGSSEGPAPRGIVASGLSRAEKESLNTLLDRVSQQTVGLQATALLHQLAARCRRDGAFAEGFAKLASHLAVASSSTPAGTAPLPGVLPPKTAGRPTFLQERTAAVGVAEPLADAESIAPPIPLPAAVPFKPILLDLSFNYFSYPSSIVKRAPKEATAATKKESGSGSGSSTAAAPAASAAAPPASPGGEGAGGSGLLGWFKGK